MVDDLLLGTNKRNSNDNCERILWWTTCTGYGCLSFLPLALTEDSELSNREWMSAAGPIPYVLGGTESNAARVSLGLTRSWRNSSFGAANISDVFLGNHLLILETRGPGDVDHFSLSLVVACMQWFETVDR